MKDHASKGATVYTDDAKAFETPPFEHDSVKHYLREFGKSDVHSNGIESLWSIFRRAHKGTFHKMSPNHVDGYVQDFAGRHKSQHQGEGHR